MLESTDAASQNNNNKNSNAPVQIDAQTSIRLKSAIRENVRQLNEEVRAGRSVARSVATR